MKRLNAEEIKQMADALIMEEEEAREVAEIFADIYENEQNGRVGWKIGMPLDSADDYIREWENHWHREINWQEFYTYEKENCYDCYDYDDAEAIFKTVDSFKNHIQTYDIAYELKCSSLIIIVG
jgi:hypothetical protein